MALRVECREPVVAVGQRDIVEQVVANLVGNALKHTDEGEVVLRAAQDGEGHGRGRRHRARHLAGRATRIFDRFYSVEVNGRDGFGLGLAIARESAEAIGGTLTIESESGRGTTARVVAAGGEAGMSADPPRRRRARHPRTGRLRLTQQGSR